MENKQFVFVYGTLRRNEGNHRLLEGAACIAQQAWTTGLLFDTGNGYPVLQTNSNGRVYGELYKVNKSQMKILDRLEGFHGKGSSSNFYDRITQQVDTDQGNYDAYVYIMNPKKTDMFKKHIPSGDWKVYRFLIENTSS